MRSLDLAIFALFFFFSASYAAIRQLLITANTRFRLAPTSLLQRKRPLPPTNISTVPYSPKCIAAIGFAENYPLINDKCVLTRWRPGQSWRFDNAAPDRWQPVRVGPVDDDYCLSVDIQGIPQQQNATQVDMNARVVVQQCQGIINGTAVREQAMWRIVGNGNGTYWFRNLRNKLCITGSDERDEFRMSDCRDDPLQKYSLQWLK